MNSKYYWPVIDAHLKKFKLSQKAVAQQMDVPANVITKLKKSSNLSEEESVKVDMWCTRHLGYQCKQYRDDHKLSQTDMAKFAGSKQSYISLLETMNPVSEETIAPLFTSLNSPLVAS